ncbi:MAG: PASTA domain-containing protein, partial [Gemmatimonadetes bacterium]|nr:PASTA domain-containing protein [Gemmatimonadota bacterium]
MLAAIIGVVSFGVGYLLSTLVLFPRPETAGAGVPVPELYDQTLSDAEATLRELGLELGDVRELTSATTDSGRVLAQDPVPGQQLLPGASVAVGVSAGAPELRVPPLAGLGQATARDLLETLGFDVAVQQTRSAAF